MQGWIDREDRPDGLLADDVEEDEEYLEAAEKFEAQYNHRFEVSAPPCVRPHQRRCCLLGSCARRACEGGQREGW